MTPAGKKGFGQGIGNIESCDRFRNAGDRFDYHVKVTVKTGTVHRLRAKI